jgi:hypothetical protein
VVVRQVQCLLLLLMLLRLLLLLLAVKQLHQHVHHFQVGCQGQLPALLHPLLYQVATCQRRGQQ